MPAIVRHHYRGLWAAIATMHGKESAIAHPFCHWFDPGDAVDRDPCKQIARSHDAPFRTLGLRSSRGPLVPTLQSVARSHCSNAGRNRRLSMNGRDQVDERPRRGNVRVARFGLTANLKRYVRRDTGPFEATLAVIEIDLARQADRPAVR